MSAVGRAWRLASRRQKGTIVFALLIAVAGLTQLGSSPAARPTSVLGAPSVTGPDTSAAAIAEATPSAATASPAGSSPPSAFVSPSSAFAATPRPTPRATPRPTSTPKPTVKPTTLTVRLVSLTRTVARNGTASITVRATAGARCSIEVDYASGPSSAAGLVDKTALSSGLASWSWKVGGRTTTGTWPIHVTCSRSGASATLSTSFTVV